MTTTRTRAIRFALLAASCVGAVPPAVAVLEGEPFASVQVLFDDNLFRFADEAEAQSTRGSDELGDVRRQLRAGAVLQYTWGLQRVIVGGEWRRNTYARATEINHEAWEAGLTADWQVTRVFDGQVQARYQRELENFEDRDTATLGFRRRLELDSISRVKVTPRWLGELALELERLRHSLDASQGSDRDEVGASLGATYEILRFTRLGASLKWLRGDYPERAVDPNGAVAHRYRETGVALVFERVPSGLSTIEGELGYTRRSHPRANALDFAGVTGRLRYQREVSGKLVSEIEAFRRINSVEEADANFRLQNGLLTRLRYRWSPKLEALASAEYHVADFDGSAVQAGGVQAREDRVSIVQAGIDYRLLWWLGLSTDLTWESRDSNRDDRSFDDLRIAVQAEARYD